MKVVKPICAVHSKTLVSVRMYFSSLREARLHNPGFVDFRFLDDNSKLRF